MWDYDCVKLYFFQFTYTSIFLQHKHRWYCMFSCLFFRLFSLNCLEYIDISTLWNDVFKSIRVRGHEDIMLLNQEKSYAMLSPSTFIILFPDNFFRDRELMFYIDVSLYFSAISHPVTTVTGADLLTSWQFPGFLMILYNCIYSVKQPGTCYDVKSYFQYRDFCYENKRIMGPSCFYDANSSPTKWHFHGILINLCSIFCL